MGCSKSARKQKARKKQQGGQSNEELLQRAYDLHQDGNPQEAQKTYEAFLSTFPHHGEALGNFGLLLHSQGQRDRAVELYQQAVALSPRLDHLYYFLGNGLRELGRHEEAIAAYKKSLTTGHNKPDTLLHLGLAHVNSGQLTEAKECFKNILQINPEDIQASYHLGLLFFQQEQFSKAVDCFAAVLASHPDHVDACFNLALCHKHLGQTSLAVDYLQQASKLDSQDADILYNIGVLHKEQEEIEQAEATFLQALEIDPENGICLTDLAIIYHIQNRLEEAKTMYQRALEYGYRPDSSHHMLAALHGETTAATPLQHIRDLFNNYARDFDKSLMHDLHYSVPDQLAQILPQLQEDCVVSSAVDLGCGTGLSGVAFRALVQHLTGVDLSENMLALAAEKQLYDELHCTGIIDFLHTCDTRYDLAIATDVFVYMGGLEPFFQLMERSLNHGGFLLFSVESCAKDYCLRQSGRYAHSEEYISRLADRFNFTIQHQKPTGIRKERGEWIPGELYIMQR